MGSLSAKKDSAQEVAKCCVCVCVCLCVFLARTYSRGRRVSGCMNLGDAEEEMCQKRHGEGAVGRISFQLLA